jgi:hypothetical protein
MGKWEIQKKNPGHPNKNLDKVNQTKNRRNPKKKEKVGENQTKK